jgi:hypothetical protein
MIGARQIIAVIIPFRKSNKNSLERPASANGLSRKKSPYITRIQDDVTDHPRGINHYKKQFLLNTAFSVDWIYYQNVYSDWHIKQLQVSVHESHLQVIS